MNNTAMLKEQTNGGKKAMEKSKVNMKKIRRKPSG
jgi:hypothetical protein